MLTNSALPLAEALFGMLLLSIDPPPASIWRWGSAFGFAAQVLAIVATRNRTQRLSRAELAGVHKFLFYPIALLAAGAMVLQAINFSVWNRFWPFFTLIFVHLIAALAQFVRMVLLPPHSSAD